jgi:glycosyltransferase involved in cell wall biosynthesis
MPSTRPVTVVIAVRDGERHLDKTLESVRHQSYSDLEVIVVDDGSTDGSAEIVRRNAVQDSRVRLVQVDSIGVARARNLGIEQARGDLIALVDGDDLWHRDRVAAHVRRFAAGGDRLAAVWSPPVTIDEDDRIIAEVLASDRATMAATDGWVLLPMLYRFFPACGSTATFRKSALLEAGGFADDVSVAEDFDLILRIAEQWQVGVVPQPLVGYRQVPQSRSSLAQINLRSQKRILHDLCDRAGWIPRWAVRWSMAGRYVAASSRAFGTRRRVRGVLYGVAAVSCDPFVLLHPSALPQTFRLLFRRTGSSRPVTGYFPDDVEAYLESVGSSSGRWYAAFAWLEARRRRRMVAAELLARGLS